VVRSDGKDWLAAVTTMITEVYDALLSAGADDGKARRAAEVLADYDDRFASLERRIDGVERRIGVFESNVDGRFAALEAGMDGRFAALEAKVDGKFNLLAWMLGVPIAAVSALVIRAFA
jgi:hypothetical protein